MDLIYVLIACSFTTGEYPIGGTCITSPPVSLETCYHMALQLREEKVLPYTTCVQFIKEKEIPVVVEVEELVIEEEVVSDGTE